ncbi:MAG: hypothetical protein H6858_09365 [Rhodospirillales bacterium]|nr:hypothetical protein [Alphaproteobacteria bacterium]MCB9977793.1 hypothetical protein [Rhodospirillales bacterium]
MKPPILQTVIASYVFLIKNFTYALKVGWPFIVFVLFISGLLDYAVVERHNAFLQNAEDFEAFENSSILNNPFFPTFLFCGNLLILYFLTSFCINWIRAATRGIGRFSTCNPFKDYKLVLSCYLYTFFYVLMIIPFFSPLFLGLAAKANNQTIASDEAYRFFNGLKLRFSFTLLLCYLPFLILEFVDSNFFFAPTDFSSAFTFEPVFFIINSVGLIIVSGLSCGVLSAYYLWYLRNPDWIQEQEETYYPTELDF